LIQNIYKIGAIKIGEFTLKSGQHSTVYVDLRRIISYPDVLRAVANRIWESLRHAQFDLICGIPYTALPIATCISLQHNIPMIMRRKEKKEYGTKQMIEGVYKPGQSCVLIEDIITTGGSVLETARDMDEAGLVVKDRYGSNIDQSILGNKDAIINNPRQLCASTSASCYHDAINFSKGGKA
jgi:uridine monophosphate synthetase